MTADDRSPHGDASPWSRPSVVISGVFVLVLLILGAVLYFTGPGTSNHHHANQARVPPPTSTAPLSTSGQQTIPKQSSGACTLPPGPQQLPSSAPPPHTTWESVDAMVVPQAPSLYGPQHTSGGYSTCFAHSPAGALLATLNFYGAATTNPPGQVLRHLAVGVPATLPPADRGGGLDSGGNGNVQIAGYRYDSYTPTKANIAVVLTSSSRPTLIAVSTQTVWIHGDWKVLYPTGGTAPQSQIPNLDGYVRWKDF